MSSKKEDHEPIEIRCPVCKARVRIDTREAERTGTVQCPRGHEISLVKALGV